MKSIRYMLGGRPHNLDDCLDYALKSTPKLVIMALTSEEHVTAFTFKHLFANFHWEFEDKSATYKKAYTTIFVQQSEKKQKAKIDKANKKLEADLEKIANAGININGEKSRFDYSLIY